MILVGKAPAYATVQDLGRSGFLANGVPRAGAMDAAALRTLNVMLGNDDGAAGLEWALTGGQLNFAEKVTFAFGGANAEITLGIMPLEPYRAYHATPDDLLKIASITAGRFLYIAFAGGLDVPVVMHSRSTYVPGAFGGLDGRRLKTGDTLSVALNRAQTRPQVSDPLPAPLRPSSTSEFVRYVPRIEDGAGAISGRFSVSTASDRTGYRLAGEIDAEGASITSEPVCPGAIQLPPGGEPIVLMADAPTIGGYKIIGGVISADIGVLAQRMPGESVLLEPVTVQTAQRESAKRVETIERVREWALG